ncbi:MAG: hypothetical protein NE334_10395 [Lentisphaeraceae bacterium]|nr:hypothetical protein [Lentisphaeraceae bacterium]
MVIFYNLVLLILVVVYTPIHLIKLCFSAKYRKSTLARIGFQTIPKFSKDEEVFWIHSVSVGETQVAKTLVQEILERSPQAKIVISTITETGQAVAKKIPRVAATFYYPLDFSWLASSMLRRLKPKSVFIVETDLWFNLLNGCKKRQIPLFLVNGKISKTTLKRYKQFPKLAKRLLDPFHHFFVQSETYYERFLESGIEKSRLSIAGNVKLDCVVEQLSEDEKLVVCQEYGINTDQPSIVIGSTHAGEEELSIKVYKNLQKDYPALQFILVPRHPERFAGVADLLKSEDVNFSQASKGCELDKNYVLVDKMGALMKLYAVSDIAVVAGSFTPHIGGHNIFEPSFYGKPFIYGPWIYKQPGFHQMNLEFEAGVQCSPEDLEMNLRKLLDNKKLCEDYGSRGLKALDVSKGATKKIVDEVFEELKNG